MRHSLSQHTRGTRGPRMPVARSFLLAVMALMLSFAGASCVASAQGFGAAGQAPNIRASLEVEGPVSAGGETTLAIRFVPISEEWHGYWSNPGDAGLGMQIEWELPPGVTIGEFRVSDPQPADDRWADEPCLQGRVCGPCPTTPGSGEHAGRTAADSGQRVLPRLYRRDLRAGRSPDRSHCPCRKCPGR